MQAENRRERFAHAVARDSDSFRILTGVEFDPYALIFGKAAIGYQKLTTRTPGMPEFSGLVAAVSLSYAYQGTTRVDLGVTRDLQYSYDPAEPFYIQTGYNLMVTQPIVTRWDAQVRGGRYRLDYQRAGDASTATPDRLEYFNTLGGGFGYHLSGDTRVGFNLDYFRRQSDTIYRGYKGLRGGLVVTYGF